MPNGGLTLSEESLKRLVPTTFARSTFLRQQVLAPETTAALAEGTLRAAAKTKSERLANVQRITESKRQANLQAQVQRESIAESKRASEAAAVAARRARKAAEPTFIETLFST